MRDMPEKLVYSFWAPPTSPWSPWVKPVLFAHMDEKGVGSRVFLPQSKADVFKVFKDNYGDTALIVNLPGVESVAAGLELIDFGYRPIPLYNAAPGHSRAVHKLDPVIHALEGGTERLNEKHIDPDAPPAFLIDADRIAGPRDPKPGTFDNRWVIFPQDVPSAGFLKRQNINRVVLIQDEYTPAWQDDLCHILCRWQDAGIAIEKLVLGKSNELQPVKAPRPSYFRSLYYRWLTTLKFRRNSAGGFGGNVPQPSEGGGGYGGGFG
ncbi:MAG: hypothetical protein R3C45_08900 [Phycisphaerales bacterium]